MKWLGIIILAALIGGIIGLIASGGRKEGFLVGAFEAGSGCAGVVLQIFLWGIAIVAIIKLFGWLFG